MVRDVVAIDGPAGAGKSTVAKAIAKALGFSYLDTGAMYRAVALLTLRAGATARDGTVAAKIAREMDLRFELGDPQRVIVNGEDVTVLIRTPEISEAASALSAFTEVRKELVARQTRLCDAGRVVLEGRDTTTVVCPDARLKIYLDASVEQRAKRRRLEMPSLPPIEEIQAQIAARDERDMTRADSPLRKADEAFVIDTDGLTADEVVQRVLDAWDQTAG